MSDLSVYKNIGVKDTHANIRVLDMFVSQVSKKPTLKSNKTKVFQVLTSRKFTVCLPFSVNIHYSKSSSRRIAGKHSKQEKVGGVNPV